MNKSQFLRLMMNFGLVAVVFTAAAMNAPGQTPKAKGKEYDPPRLWDSKTPDFRGIWQVRDTAYVNIEGHPAENGVPAAKSIIVDPPGGKIPYLPDALAKVKENYKNRLTADPAIKCYEAGVPRAVYLPHPFQIVQSPGNFAIVYEDNHAFRIVYPDAKPHFEGIDWWMGDSRGHWEGNTFVVDVTTLNEEAWFDDAGNHHSDDMHVVERYTLTGPNTLQYEARVDDAKTFSKPWTIRTTLYRNTQPGARIIEDECLEDQDAVRHHISPSDPKNLQINNIARWKNVVANKEGGNAQ